MTMPLALQGRLRLPVIGAPMFLVSTPKLVAAQCRAGIVGSMPALNARTSEQLDDWLAQLTHDLAQPRIDDWVGGPAPFAINQIVARSNTRQEADLALLVKHKVPVVITSVGSPGEVVKAVHGYGGLVFHDVVSVRHAQKAAEAGVDGIVAVCAGAGGHGGTMNPFALINDIRSFFSGTLLLSGSLGSGKDILAAQVMGADLAYMGTRFLGSAECEIDDLYKQMILASNSDDIVYTDLFSGLRGNYLKKSIARTGLDPNALPPLPESGTGTGGHGEFKLWKDIWAAGQGVGAITDILPVDVLIARLDDEYRSALSRCQALGGRP
jgi:nitronate monooxygenase